MNWEVYSVPKEESWFAKVFGSEETIYEETRGKFEMQGEHLICSESQWPRQQVGPFELITAAEAKERYQGAAGDSAGLRFEHLPTAAGVEPLIMDPANAGAVPASASFARRPSRGA